MKHRMLEFMIKETESESTHSSRDTAHGVGYSEVEGWLIEITEKTTI